MSDADGLEALGTSTAGRAGRLEALGIELQLGKPPKRIVARRALVSDLLNPRRLDDGTRRAHQDTTGQRNHGNRPRIRATCPQPDNILPRLQHVGAGLLAVRCQVSEVERHLHALSFVWLQQTRLRETGEFLPRLLQLALGRGHIYLHDLLARTTADVLDVDRNVSAPAIQHHRRFAQLKLGIRQPEPERKQRALAHRVEIAVPDVNALAIRRVIEIAHLDIGAVVIPSRPRGGKLARRHRSS